VRSLDLPKDVANELFLSAIPGSTLKPRISATVLTFNEVRHLERCLDSLRFADEILVVDSGSTDGTVELARNWGARVVIRPWNGFLAQREYAFSHVTGDWILFLDADEWLPAESGCEIVSRIRFASDETEGFRINRRNWFLDRWMDHAWGPDYCLRLFRRGRGRLGGHEPHIHVELESADRLKTLKQPLNHEAYSSIRELLDKADRYSSLFAESDATDPHFGYHKLVLSPLVSLFKTYVIKRGFLDGMHGHVVAGAGALYHFLKYAKKWEKLKRSRPRIPAHSTIPRVLITSGFATPNPRSGSELDR